MLAIFVGLCVTGGTIRMRHNFNQLTHFFFSNIVHIISGTFDVMENYVVDFHLIMLINN